MERYVTILRFIVSECVIDRCTTWHYAHFDCLVRLSIALHDDDLDLPLLNELSRWLIIRVVRSFSQSQVLEEDVNLVIRFQNDISSFGNTIPSCRFLSFPLHDPVSPFNLVCDNLHFLLNKDMLVWIIDVDCEDLILVEGVVDFDTEELILTWDH